MCRNCNGFVSVCAYSGYNVIIVWGLIELVGLFQNIYIKWTGAK